MNKIMVLLMSFSVLLLLVPVGYNAVGAYQTEMGDGIFIFVQSTIRDHDGNLVAYLESSKFTDLNIPALNIFLDFEASIGADPVITVDAQKYQVIRRVQSQSFESDGLVASIKLVDSVGDTQSVLLARFAHDGYLVVAGDRLESMWTFVRLVS